MDGQRYKKITTFVSYLPCGRQIGQYMWIDILKGFIVGICASAPIGPISILVIQQSRSKGHRAGFITGLGASVVDTLFSIIAIFALAFVQSFISNYQVLILIAGGIILSILGLSMSFSDPFRKMKSGGGRASATDFGQALVMGLTNPGAVFVILTLFAFFGIGSEQHPHSWSIAPVVLAVSGGSVLYWFMVTWALSHFRKKFKMNTILWISRLTGAVVVIMGIALLGQGLFKVIFQGASLL